MTVQQYLDDGCEIVNALIVKADISTDDIPSVDVQLKLPMGGVVFGGICFGQSIRGSEQMPHGWAAALEFSEQQNKSLLGNLEKYRVKFNKESRANTKLRNENNKLKAIISKMEYDLNRAKRGG